MSRVSHVKKNDTVVALSGAFIGQTGKVLAVKNKSSKIQVEGLGAVKKHIKPNQQNPKGGIVEQLRWWPASKFMVCDSAGKKLGRVGFKAEKGATKERTYSGGRK
ncbi:MAG: 50S ribosomal protein L24 [Bdellovibrionota bacterium]